VLRDRPYVSQLIARPGERLPSNNFRIARDPTGLSETTATQIDAYCGLGDD